jgi:hypothetical protein
VVLTATMLGRYPRIHRSHAGNRQPFEGLCQRNRVWPLAYRARPAQRSSAAPVRACQTGCYIHGALRSIEAGRSSLLKANRSLTPSAPAEVTAVETVSASANSVLLSPKVVDTRRGSPTCPSSAYTG